MTTNLRLMNDIGRSGGASGRPPTSAGRRCCGRPWPSSPRAGTPGPRPTPSRRGPRSPSPICSGSSAPSGSSSSPPWASCTPASRPPSAPPPRGRRGIEAMAAMGDAYKELLGERDLLLVQLHAFAASEDEEIRRAAREGFRHLWTVVGRAHRASPTRTCGPSSPRGCSSTSWPPSTPPPSTRPGSGPASPTPSSFFAAHRASALTAAR